MEVLLRWNHPRHGLIFPDQFIGRAEDCGAIEEITYSVARDALKARALWCSQGLHVQLSLNLSMENLRAPDFARDLTALVRSSGTHRRM